MNKFIVLAKKNWKYILIALITFAMGSTIGPSDDELAAAQTEIEKLEKTNITLEETNAALTEEKDKLVSENENLQAKLDDAAIWLELSDEQQEQIEADLKAAEEQAKKEAEEKAKAEAEAKAQQEAELAETSNDNVATGSSSSSVSSTPTGPTVYTTPTGKKYHLDPDCGGKNSRPTTKDKVAGLTPCQKCAQ